MKLCAAGMLLVMAWAAPAAGAAEITHRARVGDVSGGAGIAKRQRAALDIERVTARANAAGLAVDVRLRVDCPGAAATLRAGAVELTIPSFAADPVVSAPNPCPDAALSTAATRLAGNPGGELDEWGRERDRMRIEYRFDHAGPGAGGQNVALDWSASWK